MHIDSWRWGGVPWYLRSGKCLPVTACEVVVRFKPPPQNLFADSASSDGANCLRFRLSPHSSISQAAWAVVEPVLNEHPAAIVYEPGSWGPAAADEFIAADGGWQNPAA